MRQLPNPSISPGTKQAYPIAVHADGRLECVLTGGESDGETQFVAFEGRYLDHLIRKTV